ncbi:MAG TPA: hypothetical protein VFQ45_23370 [Longimicrobium sp.]|nr:hypothetical protein [Longimicrobium sp.]
MLGGCADALTGTVPRISAAPDAPALSSEADPEPQWPVRIKTAVVIVNRFAGQPANYADVFGSMTYNAYHARMFGSARWQETATPTVLGSTSLPMVPRHTRNFNHDMDPFQHTWQFYVGKSCGLTISADVSFEAWWQSLLWGETNTQSEPRRDTREQEPCPCVVNEGDNEPAEGGFDPYYGEPPTAGGDCDEGTGGEEPEGKQYYVGDYTGGETVSWHTGKGNGGTSACGDEARVDYVCIYEFNPETEEWELWDCGYVTTCG